MTPCLTPRQVAERVNLSYAAVLRAIRDGQLRAFEPRKGHYRVRPEDLEAWIEDTAVEPAAPDWAVQAAATRPARRTGRFRADLRAMEGDRT